MKKITLTLRDFAPDWIDLARVRLDEVVSQPIRQLPHLALPTSLGKLELGELFQVEDQSSAMDSPTLVLRGACQRVHSLGHQHRLGLIQVEGDIGDYCGACMSGGTIRIQGNAGDHLAAPTGSRSVGMNGGLLCVTGSAGHFAGYRMRRGEIRIAGDTGNNLASWQVAGTICVGGSVGENVAFAMRRGTLVLTNPVRLPGNRFTDAIALQTPFQDILLNRIDLQRDMSLTAAEVSAANWTVSRGDRSIDGMGEVWMPES